MGFTVIRCGVFAWVFSQGNRTYHSWEDQLGRQEIPNDVIQNPTVFVVFHFYRRVNSD